MVLCRSLVRVIQYASQRLPCILFCFICPLIKEIKLGGVRIIILVECIYFGIINGTADTAETINNKAGFCFMEPDVIQCYNSLERKILHSRFVVIIYVVIATTRDS